jgi:hypothetical protein
LKEPFADEARMSTAKAKNATHLDEWLPSQPEGHEPYGHVEVLGRGKELLFEGSTTRFHRIAEAG